MIILGSLPLLFSALVDLLGIVMHPCIPYSQEYAPLILHGEE